MIVHGTRGFKSMEIIGHYKKKSYCKGHDVLSINLSYGFSIIEMTAFYHVIIKYTHNEHESVREIVDWYEYLLSKNYKKISMVGHSRGGFNIVQAAALINKMILSCIYLLPIVDTYRGTRNYYITEHNLPYDEVIQNEDEYIISERYPPINFLFCENAQVSSNTFRSYLDFSENKIDYPFTFDILKLLRMSNNKVSIYSGSSDEILLDSYKKSSSLSIKTISIII